MAGLLCSLSAKLGSLSEATMYDEVAGWVGFGGLGYTTDDPELV